MKGDKNSAKENIKDNIEVEVSDCAQEYIEDEDCDQYYSIILFLFMYMFS